jgi:hypothetical protein
VACKTFGDVSTVLSVACWDRVQHFRQWRSKLLRRVDCTERILLGPCATLQAVACETFGRVDCTERIFWGPCAEFQAVACETFGGVSTVLSVFFGVVCNTSEGVCQPVEKCRRYCVSASHGGDPTSVPRQSISDVQGLYWH